MNSSWLSPKLKVQKTSWGERGLFALSPIDKDETLIIFGGCVMTIERFCNLSLELQNYQFQILDDFFFGPLTEENLEDAYFLNHSCKPNAGFKSEIILVAMRDISTGEPVTIDYATCLSYHPLTVDRLAIDPCLCGEKNCRKVLTSSDWEISELQVTYDGYFQPFLQEKIEKRRKQ